MTTARSTDVPVLDFDHHSAAFAENLEGIVREVRQCPVAYTENNGGHYIVSSHALAKQVLADPATFSSARDAEGNGGLFIPTFPIPIPGGALLPAEADPPFHTTLRRGLDIYFNRPAMEKLRPRINEVVTGVFDAIEPNAEFNVVDDIGHVVGPTMMMGYCGFPMEFKDEFIASIRTGYMRKPGDDDVSELIALAMKVIGVVQAKRAEPAEDVASYLTRDLPDLDDVAMTSYLITLLFAGFETTEALITNSMWYLDQDRGLRERLGNDRSLIPNAIEEFLRVSTPETTTVRTVTRDVTLGEAELHAGDRVLVLLTAGNHDASVFADPDTIDITRNCGKSLAFGHGAHRCPGNHMTKLEGEIILNQMLDRIPNYSLDRANCRRFTDRAAANGWITMPAFTNLGQ